MSMMTDLPLILNHPRAWLLSGTHATLAAALAALQPQLAAADPLPSLNQSAFASLPALSGRLVTFDAMVQDTSLAPQIYPLSYTTDGTASSVGSGFFLDQLPPPILDPRTRITQYGDRQPVYLVSVPDEATPVPADRVMPGTDKNKYPLPGVGHQACVAKYYPASTRLPAMAAVGGSSEPAAAIELPALGSVVTVTGILEWSGHAEDDDGHQVPTIHVLFSSAHVPAATLPAEISLPDLRTCLINHLAARFFQNDRLAAELVLLHILHTPPSSRATNSTSAAAAADELSWPHSLPLTLIVPPTDTWIGSRDWLSDLGTLLAIPATSLSLTQSTLSTSTFAPRATSLDTTTDTDEEGICAGRLQLAASSLLLVSDRDLEPGQLGDKAVRNLQVLHKVLKTHTLPYVFPYTEVAVPAAYAKVVVTDALGGEVVPRGVRVVVEPTDAAAAAVDEVDEEVVRAYVAHVRASNECKMPQPDQDVDKVQAAVEAAYVADRRKTTAADNANTPVDGPEALDGSAGPAQLHWQLALARRVGRSRGKASVGIDEWEWARKMDAERRERVRKIKKGHKVLGVQAGVEGAGEEPRR